MLATVPDTLTGKRDGALLALGFARAFRRSELIVLEVADLSFDSEGLRVHIGHSKTDQEGRCQEIAIPRGTKLRPVKSLEGWLEGYKRARYFAQSTGTAGSARRCPPNPSR